MSIEKSNVVIHSVWGIIFFTNSVVQNYFFKLPAANNSLLLQETIKARLHVAALVAKKNRKTASSVFLFLQVLPQSMLTYKVW